MSINGLVHLSICFENELMDLSLDLLNPPLDFLNPSLNLLNPLLDLASD